TTDAQDAINGLTFQPPFVKGGLYRAVVAHTQSLEADLNALVASLATSADNPLTIDEVDTILFAEAEAYRAFTDTYLFQYSHPFVSRTIDTDVSTLESQVDAIAAGTSTGADVQSQVAAAVATFDGSVLDTNGLLGPRGLIGHFFSGLASSGGTVTPTPTPTPT